jgi:DNA-binding transcriptional LysR family regulator
MQHGNLNDLLVFRAVATERSFTRAAAKLGVSQSALSHTIRALEERLGLRLLTRTRRSVAPTEAGERLLHTVAPRFEEIEAELEALSELREKPSGTIRITATDYAVDTILWPRLTKFLRRYPDVKLEIIIEYGLTDIVADNRHRPSPCSSRHFATVRLGRLRMGDPKGSIEQRTSANHTEPFTRSPEDRFGSACDVPIGGKTQATARLIRKPTFI